jgi:hypothetical protein
MEASEPIYGDKDGNIVELGGDPNTPTFLLVAKGMEIPAAIEEKMKKKKAAAPNPALKEPEKKKDLKEAIDHRHKRIVTVSHKRK